MGNFLRKSAAKPPRVPKYRPWLHEGLRKEDIEHPHLYDEVPVENEYDEVPMEHEYSNLPMEESIYEEIKIVNESNSKPPIAAVELKDACTQTEASLFTENHQRPAVSASFEFKSRHIRLTIDAEGTENIEDVYIQLFKYMSEIANENSPPEVRTPPARRNTRIGRWFKKR